jgi:DNA-binding transcriptional regulator YhcF (GntR family)
MMNDITNDFKCLVDKIQNTYKKLERETLIYQKAKAAGIRITKITNHQTETITFQLHASLVTCNGWDELETFINEYTKAITIPPEEGAE